MAEQDGVPQSVCVSVVLGPDPATLPSGWGCPVAVKYATLYCRLLNGPAPGSSSRSQISVCSQADLSVAVGFVLGHVAVVSEVGGGGTESKRVGTVCECGLKGYQKTQLECSCVAFGK